MDRPRYDRGEAGVHSRGIGSVQALRTDVLQASQRFEFKEVGEGDQATQLTLLTRANRTRLSWSYIL